MLRSAIAAVALSALGLVGFGAEAEPDLLSKPPMRDWMSWIQALQPTRDYYRGPNERLTPAQWAIERPYIVLFRLGQQCENVGYAINTDPFDFAVTRLTGSGWAGITMLPGHTEIDRGGRISDAVDAAFEEHGKRLCAAFNRRLGRNGDLIAPLREFTAGNKPGQRYTTIVMWSDAEICARPEEFWVNDWHIPTARAALEVTRAMRCRSAEGQRR